MPLSYRTTKDRPAHYGRPKRPTVFLALTALSWLNRPDLRTCLSIHYNFGMSAAPSPVAAEQPSGTSFPLRFDWSADEIRRIYELPLPELIFQVGWVPVVPYGIRGVQ